MLAAFATVSFAAQDGLFYRGVHLTGSYNLDAKNEGLVCSSSYDQGAQYGSSVPLSFTEVGDIKTYQNAFNAFHITPRDPAKLVKPKLIITSYDGGFTVAVRPFNASLAPPASMTWNNTIKVGGYAYETMPCPPAYCIHPTQTHGGMAPRCPTISASPFTSGKVDTKIALELDVTDLLKAVDLGGGLVVHVDGKLGDKMQRGVQAAIKLVDSAVEAPEFLP